MSITSRSTDSQRAAPVAKKKGYIVFFAFLVQSYYFLKWKEGSGQVIRNYMQWLQKL